jgi:Na+-transporting methylmalonyl-CoA/oxaloacetate decarboxylase gamma subunit
MTAIHPIRLMSAALPEHPPFIESITYQLTGLLVVFAALGSIWVVMELAGGFFRRADTRREPAAGPVAPVIPEVAAASGEIAPLTCALIAATVHCAYNGKARILSVEEARPQLVQAIIAASVHCMFEGRARVVSVEPVHADTAWAREGRRDIFASHRIR